MNVPGRYIFAALALVLMPGMAYAEGCCNRTPTHHTPAPPSHGCGNRCAPPTIVVPPPYVPPPNIVVVNAGARASAHAGATAIAVANANTGDTFIQSNIVVSAGADASALSQTSPLTVTSQSFETQTRMVERQALIQAICMDERGNPHPASQTFGERDIADDYAGEIFRCMAGTHMRVTQDGRSHDCANGEALWYENGRAVCRTQIARRPCNERSLLRRYGPGEKVARIRDAETVQAARETQFNGAMSMDGGVGQGVW